MLCSDCFDLFQGSCKRYRTSKKGRKYVGLQYRKTKDTTIAFHLANSEGCFLCSRLWQDISLKASLIPDPGTPLSIERHVCFPAVVKPWVTVTATCPKSGRVVGKASLIHLQPQKSFALEALQPGLASWKSPEQSTRSGTSFEYASQWLQICIASHRKCRVNSTKLPTRLLELSKPSHGHLRLRDSRELPPSTSYMTLSHCWGNAQFFKLTKSTYQQLASGIPVSSLANTFRDAVHVAEKLGATYLWIDSLCIIQDSLEDWRQESVTMCDVYKGSLLNIAAAASSSSEGGCFGERDPRLVRPCLVTTKYTNRANDDFLLECQMEQWLTHDQQQPLYRRAWVVQERYLAPRVLNFGSQYLFWECMTCKASEIYPGGISAVLGDVSPLRGIKADVSGHTDMYSATYHWIQIVIEYSKCSLTKGSDKLVAIYGIAREFKVLGGAENYLAGMWRNTVMAQLLWRTVKQTGVDFPKRIRNGEYRAPSWSWASVSAPVWITGPFDNSSSVARLTAVEVDHLTDDKYGEVTNAYIRVTGCLG